MRVTAAGIIRGVRQQPGTGGQVEIQLDSNLKPLTGCRFQQENDSLLRALSLVPYYKKRKNKTLFLATYALK